MITWSGQNWYCRPSGAPTTIAVIDREKESYEEYHQRKKREEAGRVVPFGFARELEEDDG